MGPSEHDPAMGRHPGEETFFGALKVGEEYFFSDFSRTGVYTDMSKPGKVLYVKLGDRAFKRADNDAVDTVGLVSASAWRAVFHTKTGKVLTGDDIEALADEAAEGYDVSGLVVRADASDLIFTQRFRITENDRTDLITAIEAWLGVFRHHGDIEGDYLAPQVERMVALYKRLLREG